MKILIIISLFIYSLIANDFKYTLNINTNMSKDTIIQKINNINDGTVVLFDNGEYDFSKNTIELKNRKYIEFRGINKSKTILKKFYLIANSSESINIQSLILKDISVFKCIDSNNSYINNVDLDKSQIWAINSSLKINSIKAIDTWEYSFISVDKNSKTIIQNSIFKNTINHSIESHNSFIKIENNKFLKDKYKLHALLIYNSNAMIINNTFNSDNSIITKNSIANISNNIFQHTNREGSVHITKKSKIIFKENKILKPFDEYMLYIDEDCEANIIDNFTDKEEYRYFGYADEDSKIWFNEYHQENHFKTPSIGDDQVVKNKLNITVDLDIFNSIEIEPTLKYTIKGYLKTNWNIETKTKNIYLSKGKYIEYDKHKRLVKPEKYKGQIFLDKPNLEITPKQRDLKLKVIKDNNKLKFEIETLSTIKNIKFNGVDIPFYKTNDILSSIETRKLNNMSFKIKHKKDGYVSRWIEPDNVDKYKLTINGDDFGTKFTKIYINGKEYKKKLKITPIKGYLNDDIAISFDEYDDVISKGTYVVIKNNIIIEPKEYKGGTCQSIPKLGFDKKYRDIKVTPAFDNQRNLLQFKISSKVPLGDILFDNLPLKYNETNHITRARKIRDFKKTYILKIDGKEDKFKEVYKCQFGNNKTVVCSKKEKL